MNECFYEDDEKIRKDPLFSIDDDVDDLFDRVKNLEKNIDVLTRVVQEFLGFKCVICGELLALDDPCRVPLCNNCATKYMIDVGDLDE